MIDPVAEVLARLRNRGIEPQRSAQGWTACCPAHDDRSPSLSIACGDDGRVLLHCHAGCRFTEIASALGMASKELFPEHTRANSRWRNRRSKAGPVRRTTSLSPSASVPVPTKPTEPRVFFSWEAAIGSSWRPPTATWFYRDANGRVVGVVARFRAGPAGKTFRQASLRACGGWIATGMPKPRPLYRLPELLAPPTLVTATTPMAANASAHFSPSVT